MQYNVDIELDRRTLTPDEIDQYMAALVGFKPSISTSPFGRPVITVTIQAPDAHTAVTQTAGLAKLVGARALGISVLPTDEWDRRVTLPPVPPLLSVAQVAEQVGISKQAVHDRIKSGSLPHVRVGHDIIVIPAAALAKKQS